ncbi:MAG: hypothetical protein WBF82_16775 [Mycobacterium sp.]
MPDKPPTDPMLTIDPPPESLISGAHVCIPTMVAVTLISKTLCHASRSTSGSMTKSLLPTTF